MVAFTRIPETNRPDAHAAAWQRFEGGTLSWQPIGGRRAEVCFNAVTLSVYSYRLWIDRKCGPPG